VERGNVCPLATLNMASNRKSGTRKLTNGLAAKAGIVAIVLLAVLVPARRFAFNTDGTSLAIVIVAVGLLALALGVVFDAKAGFCNAICPVLPVERLYGQAPLLQVPNARCPSCSLCTQRGCIDLSPEKSVAQTLGTTRQSAAWLRTGFGAFAAAFPGFIIGYYTSSDVALSAAGSVYGGGIGVPVHRRVGSRELPAGNHSGSALQAAVGTIPTSTRWPGRQPVLLVRGRRGSDRHGDRRDVADGAARGGAVGGGGLVGWGGAPGDAEEGCGVMGGNWRLEIGN